MISDDNPDFYKNLEDFQDVEFYNGSKLTLDEVKKLNEVEISDVVSQIEMRKRVAYFFGAILIIQHFFVFAICYILIKNGQLKDHQLILSSLVASTLAETYAVARIIVFKLFESIDYKDKHARFNNKKSNT